MTTPVTTPARSRKDSAGVAEQVYQKLAQLIMQNDVAPGSRIVIDQIAAEFGVSSTPVREALAQLEAQGLVTKERLRGYRFAERLTPTEFDELWEFRLLLETNAARQAAGRISIAGRARLLAELATISHSEEHLHDDYESMRAVLEHDLRLHDLILDLAGNSFARRAIKQANVHTRLLRVYFDAEGGRLAFHEHENIVNAIINGNMDEAESAMREHLEQSFGRLRPHI